MITLLTLVTVTAALTATLVCGLPINHLQTSNLDSRHVRQAEEQSTETPVTDLTSQGNSTANSTDIMDEVAGVQGGCDTLQQALKKWHGTGTLPHSLHAIYPFFVYSEVYLNLNNYDETKSATARQNSENACANLKSHLDNTVPEESPCSWSYTCDYDPDRFPSYRIQTTSCTRKNSHPGFSQLTLRNIMCQSTLQRFPVSKRDRNGCWKNGIQVLRLGCVCSPAMEE